MARRILITVTLSMLVAACTKEDSSSLTGPKPIGVGATTSASSTTGGATTGAGGWDDPQSGSGGTQDPGPDPNTAAAQYFVDNVHPSLYATCGKCHATGALGAPQYLAVDAWESYDKIREYRGGALSAPAVTNLLLFKGLHEGPELTGIQEGIVKQWLDLEHPGNPNQSTKGLEEALDDFASCMDFGEWQLREIDDLFATQVNGGCTCETCHFNEAAAGGLLLTADAEETFDRAKTFPGIMKWVTGTTGANGAFAGLVPAERILDKGSEYNACSCQDVLNVDPNDPDYCHPNYSLDTGIRIGIEKFVETTILLSKDGPCFDDDPIDQGTGGADAAGSGGGDGVGGGGAEGGAGGQGGAR